MFSRQLRTIAEPETDTAVASSPRRRADAPSAGGPRRRPAITSELLLDLQRGFGNRHVQRVVERAGVGGSTPLIQPKMMVGPADDRFEREADRIADQVVGHVAAEPPTVHADASAEGMTGPEGGAVEPWVGHAIRTAGGGQPIPGELRSSMEHALGADLRHVRLHTDTRADHLNDALQSHAFTTGRDVFFRRGAFAQDRRSGQSLLAHELAHVVQQGGTGEGPSGASPPVAIQRKLTFKSPRLTLLKKDKKEDDQRKGDAVFGALCTTLESYEAAADSDLRRQLLLLQRIEALANEWLAIHGDSKKSSRQAKGAAISELLQDVTREIDAGPLATEWRNQYMERLVATTWKYFAKQKAGTRDVDPRFTQQSTAEAFEFITTSGSPNMRLYSKDYEDLRKQAPQLLDEEIAAIRLFTAADYKYINPTLANDETWLSLNIGNLTDPTTAPGGQEATWANQEVIKFFQTAKEHGPAELQATRNRMRREGMQHARQVLSGLKKLPNHKTQGYRGLGLTPDELKQYQKGATVCWPSFSSTSLDRHVADGWAAMATKPKVPVVLILTVNHGKDIQPMSQQKKEREILLMPGAKFSVTSDQHQVGDFIEIRLMQTGAGGDLVSSTTPPGQTATSTTSTVTATPPSSNSSSTATTASATAPMPVASPQNTLTTPWPFTTGNQPSVASATPPTTTTMAPHQATSTSTATTSTSASTTTTPTITTTPTLAPSAPVIGPQSSSSSRPAPPQWARGIGGQPQPQSALTPPSSSSSMSSGTAAPAPSWSPDTTSVADKRRTRAGGVAEVPWVGQRSRYVLVFPLTVGEDTVWPEFTSIEIFGWRSSGPNGPEVHIRQASSSSSSSSWVAVRDLERAINGRLS